MSSSLVNLGDALRSARVFTDGDWVESKDQDVDGDVRLVQLADVGDGVFIDKSSRHLTSEKATELRCTFLDQGDILIARMPDPLGRACIFPGSAGPSVTVVDVCIVRPNPDEHDPRWLMHCLNSPVMRRQVANYATGSTRSRISRGNLAKVRITVPPLVEQRRIAAILDQADALRAKRREALAHFDDLTQSIFLDMFGDPGKNEREWPLRPMSELFRSSPNYGTMIPGTEEPRPWLCLRVANIQGWALDLTSTKYVRLPPEAVERHGVLDGDMLLARAIASEDHLGKSVVVHPGSEHWAFDSHLMRLRFDPAQARPEFIRQLLRTPGGRARFLAVTRRSAVQFNINTKEIRGLELPIPPMEAQVDFLERVAAVESVRALARLQSQDLDSLYASLQARAFSGRL
jgi:type I restriction enzyme S subunit